MQINIRWFLYLVLFCCASKAICQHQPNIVWIVSEDNSKHYLKMFDSTGTATPNIERLAKQGVKYNRAFSNAPVCSVARSTLITGCYAPKVGAQHHRGMHKADLRDTMQLFPHYLKKAGYYTSNNDKEDYNVKKGKQVWDESSKTASWRNRAKGQPFFHQQNIFVSHESGLHFSEDNMDTAKLLNDKETVAVFPSHPSTPLFKFTNAYYRDLILQMDSQVGEIIAQLKADELLDHTIIFYFGDHGGALPGSKGYLYETGLHVPLVVHVPEMFRKKLGITAGSTNSTFVSFVDFAPTVLQLAGIDAPKLMDGSSIFEKQNDYNITFSYADRFDEKYDMVRAVRYKNFKYIRNFQPLNIDALRNNYRYRQLAYQEWQQLFYDRKLDKTQAAFFKVKPAEMLFDLNQDPYETTNLAGTQAHVAILDSMRLRLYQWITKMPDLGFFPEFYLLQSRAFDDPLAFGQDHQKQIAAYLAIANLGIAEFSKVKIDLINALDSEDPWNRYWALQALGSLKVDAEILKKLKKIATNDDQLINRVKAAEYLSIKQRKDYSQTIKEAFYNSKDPAEALLILNSLVLCQTLSDKKIMLDEMEIAKEVLTDSLIKRRLAYLSDLGGLRNH